jgi:putative intracellular protease/amidase
MPVDPGRRAALAALVGAAATVGASSRSHAVDAGATEDLPENFGRWHGDERIAVVLYPGVSTVGVAFALQVGALFNGGATHLVAPFSSAIPSDLGVPLTPVRLERDGDDMPYDLLIIPGGEGAAGALADEAFLVFVSKLNARARQRIASGAGVLLAAAAGAVAGCRIAARHEWAPKLGMLGFVAEDAAVVRAPGIITARSDLGLLDAGLGAVAGLRSPLYAKTMQAVVDHAPKPPYAMADAPAIARDIANSLRSASSARDLQALTDRWAAVSARPLQRAE